MARPKKQLDPDRLCAAADAALKAMVEVGVERGGAWPHPTEILGSPDQPDYLSDFTRWEVQQASEFLVRLGMIARPRVQERAG